MKLIALLARHGSVKSVADRGQDWIAGYRRAIADVMLLAGSRGIMRTSLQALLDDLLNDSAMMKHELDGIRTRERLRKQQAGLVA